MGAPADDEQLCRLQQYLQIAMLHQVSADDCSEDNNDADDCEHYIFPISNKIARRLAGRAESGVHAFIGSGVQSLHVHRVWGHELDHGAGQMPVWARCWGWTVGV